MDSCLSQSPIFIYLSIYLEGKQMDLDLNQEQ